MGGASVVGGAEQTEFHSKVAKLESFSQSINGFFILGA
jgi:hypothetical protein